MACNILLAGFLSLMTGGFLIFAARFGFIAKPFLGIPYVQRHVVKFSFTFAFYLPTMRSSLQLGTCALRLSTWLLAAYHVSAGEEWPIRDTELGDTTVQWDHYSLIVNGDRVFSFSGEFHPFRIPVPEIWKDLLEKIKAMGMNTMSFYNHWGFHAPFSDTLDFKTGAHDLARLYEYSKDTGLFVSARPGPYINGELNGGGLALWTTTGEYGELRDNSTQWRQAWKPYMDKFDEITAKYQITQNGTVIMYQIENEFPNQWKDVEAKVPNEVPIHYMEQLFQNVQHNKIVVPITHNMPGQKYKSWSVDYDTVGAGGDVHIYGLDNYVNAPAYSCTLYYKLIKVTAFLLVMCPR